MKLLKTKWKTWNFKTEISRETVYTNQFECKVRKLILSKEYYCEKLFFFSFQNFFLWYNKALQQFLKLIILFSTVLP